MGVPAQDAGVTTSCAVDPAAGCSGGDTRATAPCVSAAISTCGPGPVAPRASAPNQTGRAQRCEIFHADWLGGMIFRLLNSTLTRAAMMIEPHHSIKDSCLVKK